MWTPSNLWEGEVEMGRSNILKQRALKAKLESAIEVAEESWYQARAQDPDRDCRLYYIPPTKRQRIGRLKAATRDPKRGWRLACHMRFEPRWSRAEARCFIGIVLNRLPILRGPFENA